MKNRFAILSTVMLISAVVFVLGCLGGGGSGTAPAAPADVPAIKANLKGFFDAMSAKDPAKASTYFSAQRRASGVAGSSVEQLWVRSFGDDIDDPSDDASYTFDILQSEITWSEGRYVVPATYFGFDEPVVVIFYLVLEEGAYVIDEIGVEGGEGNLAVNASLAEFFPAREGDKLFYAVEAQEIPLTSYGILQTVTAPTTIDGRIVYTVVREPLPFSQLDSTLGEGGMPYSYDAPLGSAKKVRRSILADLFPGNESSQLEGTYRFAVADGLYYYGPNSSFNGGRPWKILNDPIVTGDVTSATVTFMYDGQAVSCQKTVTVGEYDLLDNLPMADGGAELAIPIEVTTTYDVPGNPYSSDTGRTEERAVIYLLKSVGIGAIEDYDPATGRVQFLQTALKGYVNGTVLANPVRVLDPGSLEAVAFQEFTHQFDADGGAEPYTWTGSMPAGLSISADGVLSGAPEALGPLSFDVVVHDRYGQAATYSSMISVTGDAFGIHDPGNLVASVSRPFYHDFDVVGGQGPFVWSSPDLPTGWSLDSATGVLEGTPDSVGPISLTINVLDEGTSETATWSSMISVEGTEFAIVDPGNLGAVVGVEFMRYIDVDGAIGEVTWSSSDLPPWLTLDASNGLLKGTPAVAGPYSFSITVTDAETSKTDTWTGMISVQEEATVYEIVGSPSLTLPTAIVGQDYRYVFTTSYGPDPSEWSFPDGTEPPGLTISSVASTGVLQGVPTSAGSYEFRVMVSDSVGSGTVDCLLEVKNRMFYVASQTSATSIRVSFNQVVSTAAMADPTVYAVENFELNQADKSVINQEWIVPSAVTADTSGLFADLSFGAALPSTNATLRLNVSNLSSADGNYLASGASVDIGNRVVFRDFKSWSDLGITLPDKIFIPNLNDNRIFFLWNNKLEERWITISENSFTQSLPTGYDGRWFTQIGSDWMFQNMYIATDAMGNLSSVHLVAQGLPPYDGIYFQYQDFVSGAPSAAISSESTGLTLSGTTFYGKGEFAGGARVAFNMAGMEMESADLQTAGIPQIASITLPSAVMAMDYYQFQPDFPVDIMAITADRTIRAFSLLGDGQIQQAPMTHALDEAVWSTNVPFGYDWLEDASEYHLIADPDRNSFYKLGNLEGGWNTVWEIGLRQDTAMAVWGSVRTPFWIKKYQGRIFVADADGISMFEEY